MKNYAIVKDGIIINMVVWDGNNDWLPPEGTEAIEVPEGADVSIGDGYVNGKFVPADRSAPPIVETPEQILARNQATKAQLLMAAGLAIDPLQDAVDLNVATADDKRLLLLWKQYRVAVNRLDITVNQPAWPALPV